MYKTFKTCASPTLLLFNLVFQIFPGTDILVLFSEVLNTLRLQLQAQFKPCILALRKFRMKGKRIKPKNRWLDIPSLVPKIPSWQVHKSDLVLRNFEWSMLKHRSSYTRAPSTVFCKLVSFIMPVFQRGKKPFSFVCLNSCSSYYSERETSHTGCSPTTQILRVTGFFMRMPLNIATHSLEFIFQPLCCLSWGQQGLGGISQE